MKIANEMLDSVRDDPNLLQRVITGDEAWFMFSSIAEAWCIMSSCHRVRTVNKEYYLQVMRNLREAIRQKLPDLWKNKNWLLHHDNAPAHKSLLVRDFFGQNQHTNDAAQPPYSPDLAPLVHREIATNTAPDQTLLQTSVVARSAKLSEVWRTPDDDNVSREIRRCRISRLVKLPNLNLNVSATEAKPVLTNNKSKASFINLAPLSENIFIVKPINPKANPREILKVVHKDKPSMMSSRDVAVFIKVSGKVIFHTKTTRGTKLLATKLSTMPKSLSYHERPNILLRLFLLRLDKYTQNKEICAVSASTTQYKQFQKFISHSFGSFSENRFGYVHTISAEGVLTKFIQFIDERRAHWSKTLAINLDIGKAFDTVRRPAIIKDFERLACPHSLIFLKQRFFGRPSRTELFTLKLCWVCGENGVNDNDLADRKQKYPYFCLTTFILHLASNSYAKSIAFGCSSAMDKNIFPRLLDLISQVNCLHSKPALDISTKLHNREVTTTILPSWKNHRQLVDSPLFRCPAILRQRMQTNILLGLTYHNPISVAKPPDLTSAWRFLANWFYSAVNLGQYFDQEHRDSPHKFPETIKLIRFSRAKRSFKKAKNTKSHWGPALRFARDVIERNIPNAGFIPTFRPGHGLEDNAVAIMASAKTRIYKHFLGLEMRGVQEGSLLPNGQNTDQRTLVAMTLTAALSSRGSPLTDFLPRGSPGGGRKWCSGGLTLSFPPCPTAHFCSPFCVLLRKYPLTTAHSLNKVVAYYKGKALEAIGAVWEVLTKSKMNSLNAAMKLFDSTILPHMLYAAPFWALDKLKVVDQVQNIFIRRYLNLPKYTSGFMLRMECGRVSLEVVIIKQILRFWFRIMKMEESRLPRIFLAHHWTLHNLQRAGCKFAVNLSTILDSKGFSFLKDCTDYTDLSNNSAQATKCNINGVDVSNNISQATKGNINGVYISNNIAQATKCNKNGLDVSNISAQATKCKSVVDVSNNYIQATKCKVNGVDLSNESAQATKCNINGVDLSNKSSQATKCKINGVDVSNKIAQATKCKINVDLSNNSAQAPKCKTVVNVSNNSSQARKCNINGVDVSKNSAQASKCNIKGVDLSKNSAQATKCNINGVDVSKNISQATKCNINGVDISNNISQAAKCNINGVDISNNSV
ncbi:CLCN3 [Cordylochernes scorpioides]|uniref:CLCN3 n=1 Tax=Cordylochernes scorpioides TaxID=51811 RepID=A0ABY6L6P6_9ARAC|nr:CLCN3 [Cordylochernes scorpioides]